MEKLMDKNNNLSKKLFPVSLSVLVLLLDQITKSLVVKFIPRLSPFSSEGDGSVIKILGNVLRFIHVRNKAVAFSMGSSLPQTARAILFAVIPLIVIAVVYVIYFRNNEFSQLQRWSICGVLGGGLGNLVDRFFRPEGVVDFIDIIFFGSIEGVSWPTKGPFFWLSWPRWPTFNVADTAVIICGVIFIITFIVQFASESKKEKKEEK